MYRTLLTLTALATSVLGKGYLLFDLERRISPAPVAHLEQRDPGAFSVPISQNLKVEYLINLTLGQSGQNLEVTIDTGSSGLWVPSNRFCRTKRCDLGSFDPTASPSYRLISAGSFNVSYATPGDWNAGDWVSDTVSVGGFSAIDNQIFAVANRGADSHGVFGLSLDPPQPFGPPGMNSYPSIMDNYVQSDLISRRAYSLYLNSYNQTYGSVVFGGIDNTKYTGDLVALPLQSGSRRLSPSNFYVTLSQVTFTDSTGAKTALTPDGYAQMVLIDSGTAYTYLTNNIMQRLANGVGAMNIVNREGLFVPCRYRNINATISYTFGGIDGVTITVPMSETIDTSGNDVCAFAFGPQFGVDGLSILGDSFLRSAYALFDIDNNIVALAQAVQNQVSTSNLVVVPTGTSIPGVVSTASATGTQLARTAAAQTVTFATASQSGTSIIAVTPTFNLGTATTSSSSSNGADVYSRIGLPRVILLWFVLDVCIWVS